MRRNNFKEAIDLTARVTTPENVQFDYKVAGFGRRLPAFIIDFLIRVAVMFALAMTAFCTGGFLVGVGISPAFMVAGMLIAYFIISWFYGAAFEFLRNGKTPGKSAMGIQVVMADGRPINVVAALVRNACRTADIMPVFVLMDQTLGTPYFAMPLFLPAIVCMCITNRYQRLGDIAANTMVVVMEPEYTNRFADVRDERMENLAGSIPADLVLKPSTVQALSLYIDRRLRLSPVQREELCSILVDAIRTQFELPKDESNDALVCALHYREFYKRDDKFDLNEAVQELDYRRGNVLAMEAEPIQIRSQPNALFDSPMRVPPPIEVDS